MKNRNILSRLPIVGALVCTLVLVAPAAAQSGKKSLRKTDEAFFKTDEARRIGEQVLAYQRCTGGWPKNIDMAAPLTETELQQVLSEKSRRDDSTIDNNATIMQLVYLARLYQATDDSRYREAFRRGIEFLLSGQYANGGWPQFWPEPSGYQVHITYNDDAIVNTLELFRAVLSGSERERNIHDGVNVSRNGTKAVALECATAFVRCRRRCQFKPMRSCTNRPTLRPAENSRCSFRRHASRAGWRLRRIRDNSIGKTTRS